MGFQHNALSPPALDHSSDSPRCQKYQLQIAQNPSSGTNSPPLSKVLYAFIGHSLYPVKAHYIRSRPCLNAGKLHRGHINSRTPYGVSQGLDHNYYILASPLFYSSFQFCFLLCSLVGIPKSLYPVSTPIKKTFLFADLQRSDERWLLG